MKWLSVAYAAAFCAVVAGAPPSAVLTQKLIVPPELRTGPFASNHDVTLPPGFRLSVWARVPNARFMAVAPDGDVVISQPEAGKVTRLHPRPDGGIPDQSVYLSGLKQPHGLAFDTIGGTTWLYVAETDRVSRYVFGASQAQKVVDNLPGGGGHPLKSIAIAPDHTIYIGIGSSCNACAEDTTAPTVRGSVYSVNPDGSGFRMVAKGLRNPEGLAFVPGSDHLWAAVNNRDEILYPRQDSTGRYGQLVRSFVDDHPPELFTAVRSGGNYGWPFCNATQDSPSGLVNMAFDPDYEFNRSGQADCAAMDRISKGIQAHSAPLGLHFLQGSSFAAPYRNGAVIALHGSWDRTQPTGYKVVWFPWNALSSMPGAQVDLIAGIYGLARPVDTAVLRDGSLLLSDDQTGTVFRLEWAPSAVSAASGYAIVAPDSYAAVYSAAPLPSGVDYSLELTDSTGRGFPAQVVYAGAGQINFVVPGPAAEGTAHLRWKNALNSTDLGAPEIRRTAPGLFTLSADGNGPAAVTASDPQGHAVDTAQIDLSAGPVYLALYGTGVRHANAADVQVLVDGNPVHVLYAGPQPTYPALDQINIELPASLAGKGRVNISVVVAGAESNITELNIR